VSLTDSDVECYVIIRKLLDSVFNHLMGNSVIMLDISLNTKDLSSIRSLKDVSHRV
jgi:hypothetical protein